MLSRAYNGLDFLADFFLPLCVGEAAICFQQETEVRDKADKRQTWAGDLTLSNFRI